eukprot:g2744.t1
MPADPKESIPSGCPMHEKSIPSGCPMHKDSKGLPANSELPPNQRPSLGQRIPLSTHRLHSRIPKADGESGETWVYPSEQMFFNAMKRKGYNADERDMRSVIAVHNTVNERTWQQILQWEAMHCSTCAAPKLLRFKGRPKELSPKARWMNWIGYTLPFDRHDWIVDRCGTEVRYVIDYYNGSRKVSSSPMKNFDPSNGISMYIDSRPALDSFGAIWDRVRKPFMERFGLLKTKADAPTKTPGHVITEEKTNSDCNNTPTLKTDKI